MNWLKIRRIVRVLGSIIGTSVFAYLIFAAVGDLKEIPESLVFKTAFIVPALFITLIVYLMQMINYQWMVASLGGDPTLQQIVIGYAYSFLHKYIPGYLWGYFSRAEWYDREASIPATHSWGASVLEIITTVSTSLSIWLVYHLSSRSLNTIFLLTVALVPFVVVLPINLLMSLLQRSRRADRFVTSLQPIPVSKWIFITANSYLQWVVFGFGLSMIFRVFSLEISMSFKDIAGFVYSFARAWVSGFLAVFVPNGIGVREVVLKDLLNVTNQTDSTKAVLISTTYRLVMMAAEFAWVLLVVLLKRRRLLRK